MIKLLLALTCIAVAMPFIIIAIRAGMAGAETADERKMPSKTAWILSTLIWIGGLLILNGFVWATSIYTNVLWFQELGQGERYWTVFNTKITLFFMAGGISFFGIIAGGILNRHFVRRTNPSGISKVWMMLCTLFLGIVAFLSFGGWAAASWETVLQHANGAAVGVQDPLFHKDVGFYLFHLPFFRMISAMVLVFIILQVIQTALYAVICGIKETEVRYGYWRHGTEKTFESAVFMALAPVIFIGAALLVGTLVYMRSFGPYGFLTSGGGAVPFGANYVDVNHKIVANQVLMGVFAFSALLWLIGALIWPSCKNKEDREGTKGWIGFVPLLLMMFGWIATSGIWPAAVQHFKVTPNEIVLEKPFIEHNISFTRLAYGLGDVTEREMDPALHTVLSARNPDRKLVNPQDVLNEQETLGNIRLADWRALQDTFKQRQIFRQYYEFPDIDIDRYVVNGRYRQVMLSAREMNQELLSPDAKKRWVNRRLKFTHGYGASMIPVNEFDEEKLPVLLIKDIPLASNVPEMTVSRPQIYFGERTANDVIVHATEDEFDYPSGDRNTLTRYEGTAGVALGPKMSFRRFALANRFDGMKFYTSGLLKSDSRVLYHRSIDERVKTLAPFLRYDEDPYLVIDSSGRLFWMWDAYTVSKRFPYSTPQKGLNYIRNSVKIVVDAYNGSVKFYVFDESDPILKVWRNIFPSLFTPKEEMSSDLIV